MDERTSHFVGWGFFIGSAVVYIIASWRSGDALGLLGSLLFFFACFFFVIPMLRGRR